MDRNTLVWLGLMVGLYFGWQAYLDWRYPNRHEQERAQTPAEGSPSARATDARPGAPSAPADVVVSTQAESTPERLIEIDRLLYHAAFTSKGGGLQSWTLKEYDDATQPGRPPVALTTTAVGEPSLTTPFTELGLGDLTRADYAATQPDPDTLEFRWATEGAVIRKTYRFEPDGYGAKLTIEVENLTAAPFEPEFRVRWPARIEPGADFVEFGLSAYAEDELVPFPVTARSSFLGFGGGAPDAPQTLAPETGDTNATSTFELDWAGAETRYFLAAILPDNPRDARASFTPVVAGHESRLDVWFAPVEVPPGARLAREYRLYLGPKEPARLDAFGAHLDEAIQKGWAPALTRFFTAALEATHRVVPNYGIAILLLTIVVRIAMAPLMAGQMRSMKRMGELSPKLRAVQEKYGDDRQKQSEAMMAVYREAGMSPFSMFSGCLPMVLQLPIFVGFYFALQSSIQLRQQPFFGWITDLSQPEQLFVLPGIDLPVRVLPLLMGGSMVLQQRMTPSTMDPAQARMMLIVMPVMFTVMFYQFASGLVLYWLTSTLLGIGQQLIMNRQRAQVAK